MPLFDHSIRPALSRRVSTWGSYLQWRPSGGGRPFQGRPVGPSRVTPGAWSGFVVYLRPCSSVLGKSRATSSGGMGSRDSFQVRRALFE